MKDTDWKSKYEKERAKVARLEIRVANAEDKAEASERITAFLLEEMSKLKSARGRGRRIGKEEAMIAAQLMHSLRPPRHPEPDDDDLDDEEDLDDDDLDDEDSDDDDSEAEK